MADHEESLLEKITEKLRGHDSSSSDSDDEKTSPSSLKSKVYRIFGREKPVHKVFGGGKRMVITINFISLLFFVLFFFFGNTNQI